MRSILAPTQVVSHHTRYIAMAARPAHDPAPAVERPLSWGRSAPVVSDVGDDREPEQAVLGKRDGHAVRPCTIDRTGSPAASRVMWARPGRAGSRTRFAAPWGGSTRAAAPAGVGTARQG